MSLVRRLGFLTVVGVAGLGWVTTSLVAAPKADTKAPAKMSVGDVMAKGFKGKEKSLFSKVTTGQATPEQRKELTALCEAMANEAAPKGDAAEWKKMTAKLAAAAKAAEGGDAKALAALKSAGNCKACHDPYRE